MPASAAGGSVDIGGSLSWAWQKFQANAGPLIIVMLVAFVGIVVAAIASAALRASADTWVTWLLISAVSQVLFFVVSGFLQLGVYQSALTIADGRRVEPGKMFTTDQLGNYLIATLITGLLVAVGTLLCILPGIVLAYLTFLTPFYVLDHRMAPMDAVRASFRTTSSNVGQLLPFAIVVFLVYIAGAIACGVGLLVSAPVALLAITYTFRRLHGQTVAA